LSNSHETVK